MKVFVLLEKGYMAMRTLWLRQDPEVYRGSLLAAKSALILRKLSKNEMEVSDFTSVDVFAFSGDSKDGNREDGMRLKATPSAIAKQLNKGNTVQVMFSQPHSSLFGYFNTIVPKETK